MGISQFCQEHFAGNKTCSSRSEKKRKLKVLQKSFSSKNSAGHPDCYVTNQSRNVRQIFTFVAQSMETTPEKMFIFSEENMLSSKIFLWSLKNLFQKLRQATFGPSPEVKKLLVEAWLKVKLNFVSKGIFFSKKPMDIWTANLIATTKTSCQKSVTSSLVGFKKCQTASFQRDISSQNRYGV